MNTRSHSPANNPSSSDNGVLQRKGMSRERDEKLLQRQSNQSAATTEAPPIVNDVVRSPGQPLDTATRGLMESRFQHDFSHVRVHHDPIAATSARAVSARAYTVGQHIVFGTGQHSPSTTQGQKLLAHELTHVVQQQNGLASHIQRDALPLPPMETFQQLWRQFEQAQMNSQTGEALSLAVRLSHMHMDLTDIGESGLELALFLLQNGRMPEAFSVLENYRSFLWIRHIAINPIPEAFMESHYIDQLLREGEQAARRANWQTAFQLLGTVVFFAQVKLGVLSEMSQTRESAALAARVRDIDPSLPPRERRRLMEDIFGAGQTIASLTVGMSYPNLQSVYALLRQSATAFLRLQREAILHNDSTLAAQLGTQHQQFMTYLTAQHLISTSSGNVTMQSAETFNARGNVGYKIFGANGESEVVTPLPGTATPDELGFFPAYHASGEQIIGDMTGQASLVNELLSIPAIQTAFPTGEIDMNALSTRIRVWQLAYTHLRSNQPSAADALTALIRMIERYLQAFTVHTEYNIRDFGVSYLSTNFPTDLVGRAVRDCGVYALTTAYELFQVGRNASPRLNLEFQLVSMPEHVTLLILNHAANTHYLVNNDTITGPQTGDVMHSIAQAYSSTFNRGFSISPAMTVSLGDTSQTDRQFQRQGWERYQASTAWGFNAESPTGASDTRTLEQRSRDAYVHYYERVEQFDTGNRQLHSMMNAINAQVQRAVVGDRPSILNRLLNNSDLNRLVTNLAAIYTYYGPAAAGSGAIAVDSRTPASVSRHILGNRAQYLYAMPGGVSVHPLVRYCKAVLLLEHLGTTRSTQQGQIIQSIRLTPDFNTQITDYINNGFPLNF